MAAMGLVGDDLAGLTETLNSNGGQMVVQIMQFGIHVYVAPLIEGDILLWHLYFPDLKQPPTRKQEPSKKKATDVLSYWVQIGLRLVANQRLVGQLMELGWSGGKAPTPTF